MSHLLLALCLLAAQDHIPDAGKMVPLGTVEVSCYHRSLHGRGMASSRHGKYDMRRMTCAVNYRPGTKKPILPFGTRLKVVYGQRSVEVVVTDTGSHKPKRTKYWLDLSSAAMAKLMGGDIARPKTYETRVWARAWRIVEMPE